jgi:hypothetical protein
MQGIVVTATISTVMVPVLCCAVLCCVVLYRKGAAAITQRPRHLRRVASPRWVIALVLSERHSVTTSHDGRGHHGVSSWCVLGIFDAVDHCGAHSGSSAASP